MRKTATKEELSASQQFWRMFATGTMAGTVSLSLYVPVEVMKIAQQSNNTNTPLTYQRVAAEIMKMHGVRGF